MGVWEGKLLMVSDTGQSLEFSPTSVWCTVCILCAVCAVCVYCIQGSHCRLDLKIKKEVKEAVNFIDCFV